MADRMKPGPKTPIRSLGHPSDTRPNIPTAELESFARPEEKRPTIVRYPRDPSLDPQLVWRGKDEQDADDLQVPAVPIYIQETIDPLSLVEDLRAVSEGRKAEAQLDLFGPYSDLDFEERVDFYRHAGKWTNRMILGDSLLVMTSLAEKEGLKGQVQAIYIDPPYGIKFGSNWQVSTRKRDVRDGKETDLTRQPEQVKAYRDTWELGIHSYLAYLRDRLVAARELLTESGSVFVQIGDENVHLVRSLLDEVFGSENAVAQIAFYKTSSESTGEIPRIYDLLIWYARSKEHMKFRRVLIRKQAGERGAKQYTRLISPDFRTIRPMTDGELSGVAPIPEGWEICRLGPLTSMGYQQGRSGPYTYDGVTYTCPPSRHWSYDPRPGAELDRLAALGRVRRSGSSLASVLLARDNPTTELDNIWLDTGTGSFTESQTYVVQTGAKVIERCLLMTTDPGDLVLDPTCGSGTTAYVAEKWGRRWITIDTSRVALALARSRLMAAQYPYYLLADSEAGIRKEAEVSGQMPPVPLPRTGNDVRRGFVYERVPHVTLKSIAQNPDIHEGMTRAEIDAAIARNADSETLFDRPCEDRKVVRVAGPFTVESLSPHRMLADGPEDDTPEPPALMEDAARFVASILENLRRAGVQNTRRAERLEFLRLDPYPGTWIQGIGEYTEGGSARAVAVAIAPQFGTVGPELVRDAAKEAVKVADLLVVCGFAFDPMAGEEASSLGRLQILQARINADLLVGGLKKTGTGNLFTVFGEPDVDVRQAGEGELEVEIRGLDIYDPTTGELRSSSTDDVACWFLDTAYDGESFFVRHAYFTGADDPYEKLRKTLRADVSEDAWASINTTVSRPFPKPATGKIAVKVINHYGDEVMKVYGV